MTITPEEIAAVLQDAHINDSDKRQIILALVAARQKMDDYDFDKVWSKIKQEIQRKERMLN